SPSKRRKIVDIILKTPKVSERRACRVLGQARTTQRHSPHIKDDEERLLVRIIELPNTIWEIWVSKDNYTAESRKVGK
ncbi:hypothetical protein KAV79_05925, partial [Candidatus Aerophobetes bacterium]|nr:hypothetical protein [Candidatus Aerophobetes bacterium]